MHLRLLSYLARVLQQLVANEDCHEPLVRLYVYKRISGVSIDQTTCGRRKCQVAASRAWMDPTFMGANDMMFWIPTSCRM